MTLQSMSIESVAPLPMVLTHHEPAAADFRSDVLDGLTRPRKTLPCQFFYDDRGSHLFDRICELPEYYPTRTELGILRRHARDMTRAVGPEPLVVEYGSGSSTKTRLLLDALPDATGYVPIDISRGHLLSAARSIAGDYPGLTVSPVCADYTRPFALPVDTAGQNVVAYFPGSTIGNFEPDAAVAFLANVRRTCGPRSSLLIGVDRKKDPARLHAAYNDAAGVTAQFNLNLLHRINRELPNSRIDVSAFAHYAPFVPERGRMEMHLVSLKRQEVVVAGRVIAFDLGESIHTESCHKFTPDGVAALAAAAGYTPRQTWTDDDGLFGVHLLTAG